MSRFSGKLEDWALWSTRFKGIAYKKGLLDLLEDVEANLADPSKIVVVEAEKNKNKALYYKLISKLDDENATVVRNEAENDGKQAWLRLYIKYHNENPADTVSQLMEELAGLR